MLELLELIFELLFGIVDVGCYWRVVVSLAAAALLVGAICASVTNEVVQVILSIPVAFTGLVLGVIWQANHG
jgi:hypothetical protein